LITSTRQLEDIFLLFSHFSRRHIYLHFPRFMLLIKEKNMSNEYF